MQTDEAERKRKEWGSKPCAHEHLDRECGLGPSDFKTIHYPLSQLH
jgi:hypothetical protein